VCVRAAVCVCVLVYACVYVRICVCICILLLSLYISMPGHPGVLAQVVVVLILLNTIHGYTSVFGLLEALLFDV